MALPALAILLAGASPYAVQLDITRCAALPIREIARLGPDWSALAPYVRRCPVPGRDGRVALTVDVIRIDQAYAAHVFDATPNLALPSPVIRDTAGESVGTLPEGFPVDPPGRLKVRFTNWHGAVPRRIDLYEAGVSALAPHVLPPMRWDANAKAYQWNAREKGH